MIVPNEPYKSHDEALLPTRALATWAYTDLSDPRWTFGSNTSGCAPTRVERPQKIGIANRSGGPVTSGTTRCSSSAPTGTTPPRTRLRRQKETYTSGNFIELETLGPLRKVPAAAAAVHEERWFLSGRQRTARPKRRWRPPPTAGGSNESSRWRCDGRCPCITAGGPACPQ